MRPIDADALIMALRLEYPMMPMFKENQKEWEIKTDGYRKAEKVIRNAPTIEPKRGEWISKHNGYWTCSECGLSFLFYAKGNFCPNCGARMRGADDESVDSN